MIVVKQCWEDIAVLTGGVVISEDKGLTLDKATLEMLGSAKKGISGLSRKKVGKILNIYIFPSSVLWKQNSYRLV